MQNKNKSSMYCCFCFLNDQGFQTSGGLETFLYWLVRTRLTGSSGRAPDR